MRALLEIVKTTVIGGALFLLPAVLVIAVLRRGVELVRPAVVPLAERFPDRTLAGVAVATLLAVALLILICFVAGIVARTRAGRRMSSTVEHRLLGRFPLYRMLKGMLEGLVAVDSAAGMAPVLARVDDAWQLGFVLEEHDNGLRTVFVPQAPSPMSGAILFLPEDRVRRLSVSAGQVIRCISHMGIGSKSLLQGRV